MYRPPLTVEIGPKIERKPRIRRAVEVSVMSEASFSLDPSGLSICGQKKAGPQGRPPKQWKGNKTQCINRLRIKKMEGFEPVALLPKRTLRIETLYRKDKGFSVRWRPTGIVAHGERRDDAILALLATVRDTFLELSRRAGSLDARELTTLRRMRQFLKIVAEGGETVTGGHQSAFSNYLGLN
jgi:hypothetical protein